MSPLQTQFGFDSTADQVLEGCDLGGKRVLITGGTGRIGLETGKALARAGANVALAVRDLAAGERAASAIRASVAGIDVTLGLLDLADQASVRAFVAAWSGPLDILNQSCQHGRSVCARRTAEGWEKQFATNFLGHFALTVGLHRALAGSEGARIVVSQL